MKWKSIKIGEVAEIIDGDRGKNYPKQNEFHEVGYCLFLNTGNVTRDGFAFNNNMFITSDKDTIMRKGRLKRGDIVFTSRGTIGNTAYFSDTVPFDNIRINSGMVILRSNPKIVEQRYLYQILKSNYQRERIIGYITGSAQPQLPIKNFSQIVIPIPPLLVQHRIADILSAYDNLIENNQKQIKLLEEAAMRLYREWFINLRFPGYESTKINDGVPEGWTRDKTKDFMKFKYGKALKADKRKHGQYPVYGSSGVIGYHNDFLVEGPAIIVGRKGNVGSIFLSFSDAYPIDTVYYIESDISILFLYFNLMIRTFNNNDSAVPGLNRDYAESMEMICPNIDLLYAFHKFSDPLFKKSHCLENQNKLLVAARDKLLSKLMSGEIEV